MATIKHFILVLAAAAGLTVFAPQASATIIYSVCSTCSNTSGSYATTDSVPQAAGLTFPLPISFTSANLNAGVYTDPSTGIIITAMTSSGVDTGASITGGAFKLNTGGAGSGFEITLPANTFAFSFDYGAASFLNGALAIGNTNLGASNYSIFGTSGYVSIISDTALTNLFFGAISGSTFSIGDFQPGMSGGSDGGGGDTPEPSSYLLLGSGLIGLVWVQRRRRLQTKPQPIRP